MKPHWRSLSFMMAVVPRILVAGDGASPFADSSVGVIFNKDGTSVDCSKKASTTNVRSEPIARQFTHVTVDPCVWSSSVNLTDPKVPAQLFRAGADVSCTIEEALLRAPTTFADDQFAKFLEGRGLDEVALEYSHVSEIDGREFKAQLLRARMPSKFSASRPVYRVFVWLWSDEKRMVTFQCLGPAETVLREKPQIMVVSKSLRIDK
jgi:hypothetical protein